MEDKESPRSRKWAKYTLGPKPSTFDLMKKHGFKRKHVGITVHQGDTFDKILRELVEITGCSQVNIVRNALMAYYMFIKDNLKDLPEDILDKEKQDERSKVH